MRLSLIVVVLAGMGLKALAQTPSTQPSFEVASIRPSQHQGGPDYNNQIADSPSSFTARNVTLRWLVADAWQCQRNQVIGPAWLDRNEYDIAAHLPEGATRDQIPLMLRSLLSERFQLKQHTETRSVRGYELTVAPSGPRIHPVQPGEASTTGPGLHFHGDMRQFADLLAVQISIPAPTSASVPVIASPSPAPVLDKTGLEGIYDFSVDLRPEIGTDGFTFWKRVIEDQLGLRIESRKSDVEFVIVDDAAKTLTAN